MSTPAYLQGLEKAFQKNANTEKAQQMQQYMRNLFLFFGIPSPERSAIIKTHFKNSGIPALADIQKIVEWCWEAPQREYQYFAMELMLKVTKKPEPGILELYQHTISKKSWWDTVDFIAANLVGPYFRIYPDRIPGHTSKWINTGNIWLQRACLLFQLKYKQHTDTDLLGSFIEKLKNSKEFFIQKAIGWILREYSKTDPDYVKNYVSRNKLPGLSEREALKWMNKNR